SRTFGRRRVVRAYARILRRAATANEEHTENRAQVTHAGWTSVVAARGIRSGARPTEVILTDPSTPPFGLSGVFVCHFETVGPVFSRSLTVFERCGAELLAKHAAKVLRAAEARKLGDARGVEVGVRQEVLGALEAQPSYVPLEGHVFSPNEK